MNRFEYDETNAEIMFVRNGDVSNTSAKQMRETKKFVKQKTLPSIQISRKQWKPLSMQNQRSLREHWEKTFNAC